MKDDTPPEPGLTCPHCGAPVKHLAEAPKPEEEEEDMGDMPPPKKPMGDMKDTMPPKKLEGEEHVGPVEDMDSDVDADGDADGDTQDEIDKPKGNHPPPVAAAERTVSKRERALSERVKQLEAKSADYERMLRSVQKSQRREMANKLLSEGTRTGKLTPRMIGTAAQPGWAMSEAYRNPNRFSKWLKSAPRVVEFGERGTSAEDAADGAAGTAQKIEQLVQVKMAEQKALKYADAVKLVLSENRPLAEAYDREMIGERQPASAARSNVRRL